MAIKSFRDKKTEAIYSDEFVRGLDPRVAKRAVMKLDQVDNVVKLGELRIPPSNRLEKLSGDRDGQWSIRVNDQWRICFKWQEPDAYEVEFTDYHRG